MATDQNQENLITRGIDCSYVPNSGDLDSNPKNPMDKDPITRALLKDKAVNMSIYLLPADHRRLRMMAAAEETSIQALVMDGIDTLLKSRGQEPVSRWEPRRKMR